MRFLLVNYLKKNHNFVSTKDIYSLIKHSNLEINHSTVSRVITELKKQGNYLTIHTLQGGKTLVNKHIFLIRKELLCNQELQENLKLLKGKYYFIKKSDRFCKDIINKAAKDHKAIFFTLPKRVNRKKQLQDNVKYRQLVKLSFSRFFNGIEKNRTPRTTGLIIKDYITSSIEKNYIKKDNFCLSGCDYEKLVCKGTLKDKTNQIITLLRNINIPISHKNSKVVFNRIFNFLCSMKKYPITKTRLKQFAGSLIKILDISNIAAQTLERIYTVILKICYFFLGKISLLIPKLCYTKVRLFGFKRMQTTNRNNLSIVDKKSQRSEQLRMKYGISKQRWISDPMRYMEIKYKKPSDIAAVNDFRTKEQIDKEERILSKEEAALVKILINVKILKDKAQRMVYMVNDIITYKENSPYVKYKGGVVWYSY